MGQRDDAETYEGGHRPESGLGSSKGAAPPPSCVSGQAMCELIISFDHARYSLAYKLSSDEIDPSANPQLGKKMPNERASHFL